MTTREEFKERVKKWSEKIQVEYKDIHFRNMTRKWSSCSTRGRLTFDPDILEKNLDFQNETIIHELLHLRYPNHGKIFKQMLKYHLNNTEN